MKRRDFIVLCSGAAIGGVAAGAVARAMPALAGVPRMQPACYDPPPLPAETMQVSNPIFTGRIVHFDQMKIVRHGDLSDTAMARWWASEQDDLMFRAMSGEFAP